MGDAGIQFLLVRRTALTTSTGTQPSLVWRRWRICCVGSEMATNATTSHPWLNTPVSLPELLIKLLFTSFKIWFVICFKNKQAYFWSDNINVSKIRSKRRESWRSLQKSWSIHHVLIFFFFQAARLSYNFLKWFLQTFWGSFLSFFVHFATCA